MTGELVEIATGKQPSERRRIFFHGSNNEKHELKAQSHSWFSSN
jgi:hypothetical protein